MSASKESLRQVLARRENAFSQQQYDRADAAFEAWVMDALVRAWRQGYEYHKQPTSDSAPEPVARAIIEGKNV